MPDVPDAGLYASVRYTLAFLRGLVQRRAAVRRLNEQIRIDTTSLDSVLGTLGRAARQLQLDSRALRGENQAIDQAAKRQAQREVERDELGQHQEEESRRFAEIEAERENKARETDEAFEAAERELGDLEAQRRSLRDKRKQLERQQRAYIKTAEEREAESSKLPVGDSRAQLRRAAEALRQEAAALDPERQDLDRRLAALEKPLSQAAAKVELLRAEQKETRQALHDAREGNRQRRAELEAQHAHKVREAAQAEAEVGRRLVTLGTLLNLNRVERPELDTLYAKIDHLRGAIGSRTLQIDRLNLERESFDRGALVRGALVLGAGLVLVLTGIVILVAVV
jgi:chromosome segregation ATPase